MTLIAAGDAGLIMAIIVVVVFPLLFLLLFASAFFAPWLQAYTSGTPVPLISIIGMRLRRIPVQTVLRYLIMAKQSGVDISSNEMERAYLQGVDLEKVTLAMIRSEQESKGLKFQELVEADLENRLAEKLGK
ncbi:MAG: flotillin-like FloA family protein [Pirellulales bacterium]|nr:flotillin-like FloA family protein [Pirellulales bacterium]